MRRAVSLLEYFLVALLTAITLITFYQIIGRYLIGKSPYWSEQSVLLLLNYLVFLSAPLLLWRQQHIGFEFFLQKLPARLQVVSFYIRQTVLVLFGLATCYYSYHLLLKVKGHQIPTLYVSQSVSYVPILLSGIAILLIALHGMLKPSWKS